jgi:hypothetical protein
MTRRARIWLWTGLGVVCVLAVAVVVVVAFRLALVETAIERVLADRGFPEAELSVTELGTGHAVVESLSLGPGAPAARKVSVSYALGELLAGRVRSIDVEGLRLDIDLGDPDAIDRLAALAGGGAEGGGGGSSLPEVKVDDASVVLRATPVGTTVFEFEGWFDPRADTTLAHVEGRLYGGQVTGDVALSATRSEGRILVSLKGDAEAGLEQLPWPTEAAERPEAGNASITFDGTVPLSAEWAFEPASLLDERASLDLDMDVKGMALPGVVSRLDASIVVAARSRDGAFVLDLTAPAKFAAQGLDPGILDRAGLGALAAAEGAEEVRATLSPRTQGTPALRWTRTDDGGRAAVAADLHIEAGTMSTALGLTGEIDHDADFGLRRLDASDATVAVRDLSIGPAALRSAEWSGTARIEGDAVTADGPLRLDLASVAVGEIAATDIGFDGGINLSVDGGNVDAAIDAPASLTVGGPPRFGALRLRGPLAVAIDGATVAYEDGRLTAELRGSASNVKGSIARDRGEPLTLVASTGPVVLSLSTAAGVSGRVELSDAAVELPTLEMRVSGIKGAIPVGGTEAAEPVTLTAAVRATGSPARFPAATVSVTGTLGPDVIEAKGRVTLQSTGASTPVTGRVRLDTGQGELSFGPAEISFAKDGLQPKDLSAGLATMRNVSGTVSAKGALTFGGPAGLGADIGLTLDSLSAEMATAKVEGLSGKLDITRLDPLQTAPDQKITASKVVAAVPLDDVSARFEIASKDGAPLVRIAHAEGTLAEGLISVDDADIALGQASSDFNVQVDRLSLARLFEELTTEGLSGTGHLSGAIPVSLGPQGVGIADGLLVAQDEGVLHVNLGSSRDVLAQQGEQVSLMVRALENFEYTLLRIGIERPPQGETTLTIGMEGKNPGVLEGYPFRFNINLSGKLEPILTALQQGKSLSTDLLRNAIESAQ